MPHLKVVVQGGYDEPALSEELWQFGINFVCGSGDPANTGTISTSQEVQSAPDTVSDDYGSYTTNFALKVSDTPLADRLNPAAWLKDNVGPAVRAWFGATGNNSYYVKLSQVVVYAIDGTGAVAKLDGNPAKAVFTPSTQISGSNAGKILPLQLANVASLNSYRGGPGGRGRIYLPGTYDGQLAGNSTPFLSETAQTTKLSAVVDMLTGMELADTTQQLYARAMVCSGVNPSAYGRVREVRMGRVLDTQRRRRNGLAENYVSEEL